MDELELINGLELVKECIIKMCNNINRPISIPIKKWNINTRYTIICDEHHINEIINVKLKIWILINNIHL